jgi:hypothetical protein
MRRAVTIGTGVHQKLAILHADLGRRVENPKPDDVWNFRFTGNRVAVENPEEPLERWLVNQHALGPRDAGRMKARASLRFPGSRGDA